MKGKRARPNPSRPLSEPLTIPIVMNLVMLADVRTLLRGIAKTVTREINLHVEAELKKTAAGSIAFATIRYGGTTR